MNNIKKVLKAHDLKQQNQQQHFYKIKYSYTLEIRLSRGKVIPICVVLTISNDLTWNCVKLFCNQY